jgi:rhomboid protease GluP
MNHVHDPSSTFGTSGPQAALRPEPSSRTALAPRFVSVADRIPRPLPPPLDAEVDAFPGLTALEPVPTERKIRDHALVLQSMSIWHIFRRSYLGWVLLVRDEDYARAAEAIESYEVENRDWPPRPVRERPRHAPSPFVPLSFFALVLFFLVTGPVAAHSRWFDAGVSISSRVLASEPWRAVTALTLHADATHVIGNAISGTVFTSAVQRRLGAGGALLAVLASGVFGNLANALYHQRFLHAEHGSLGASTAVFGAVGLLAATQLVLGRPSGYTAKRTWLDFAAPLVGGLALLGALGSGGDPDSKIGAHTTDLWAHLFGFLSGVLLGLVASLPLRRAKLAGPGAAAEPGAASTALQATLGAIAAAIVIGTWQLAMRR